MSCSFPVKHTNHFVLLSRSPFLHCKILYSHLKLRIIVWGGLLPLNEPLLSSQPCCTNNSSAVPQSRVFLRGTTGEGEILGV